MIIIIVVAILVLAVTIVAWWYSINKTVRAGDVPDNLNLPAITEAELKEGWYRGRVSDKRKGTPPEWTHDGDTSLSAAWVKDTNTPVLPY